MKITRDVLESYLNCKYKGHLKLSRQQGTKSDYEILLTEIRAEVRLAAINKITTQNADEEIPRNIPLTASALKHGASFILDAILEDDLVALELDGLKKVDGPSKLGEFHYIPMMFHEGTRFGATQRHLLGVYGLLLSRVQGRTPAHGIIWHGPDCIATKVRMDPDLRTVERLLRDLREMPLAGPEPRLILNDHCSVCEFRQRCQTQAVQEDNLSLLRGIGEKEIKAYARKGILTVTNGTRKFASRTCNLI